MFGNLQYYVMLALTFTMFAVEVWAFVDALTCKPAAFLSAGKKTKNFWLVLTGVAVVIGFLTLPPLHIISPFGIFGLLAIVAAGVYLADVRPAVRQYRGRGGGGGNYGGGNYGGPYGGY